MPYNQRRVKGLKDDAEDFAAVYNTTFKTIVVANATKHAIITPIFMIENGQRDGIYRAERTHLP
jgi:hypothetical protein